MIETVDHVTEDADHVIENVDHVIEELSTTTCEPDRLLTLSLGSGCTIRSRP